MKNFLIGILFLLHFTPLAAQRENYPDPLDLRTRISDDTGSAEKTFFSDLGAWHAYALPREKEDYGSFIGPMMMDGGCKWLANAFQQLSLTVDEKSRDLSAALVSMHYFPGLLQQEYHLAGLRIVMRLFFASHREALWETRIINSSPYPRRIRLEWKGSSLLKNAIMETDSTTLHVRFRDNDHHFFVCFDPHENIILTLKKQDYRAVLPPFVLQKGQEFRSVQTHRYYLSNEEIPATFPRLSARKALEDNIRRWNGYMTNFFSIAGKADRRTRKLAVKCIVTLMTNWRSAAKDLLHDGVFPAGRYPGFWAWDGWKQAAALSLFDPWLAGQNVLALFDYQDSAGMIPDCIFPERHSNNLRNTKPPLAAWAIWSIFERTGDRSFLRATYDRVLRYHRWWYANRDVNGNGLCEFGSADGDLAAAKWESGMDNAARFDSAIMLQNKEHAWSMNRESIDLNAFLYAEKGYLQKIAAAIGRTADVASLNLEADSLKVSINRDLYNPAARFYSDRLIPSGKLTAMKGCEGWIPLWANIPGKARVEQMLLAIRDPRMFNTTVPLPSLGRDNKQFDPSGYWRGPVWLDQFYFALEGLKNYGYFSEARIYCRRLLRHAQGLTESMPIREYYNPGTGEGLGANNFSWSAAHLLMLTREGFF